MNHRHIIAVLLLSLPGTLYPQHHSQADRPATAQSPQVTQLPADELGQPLCIEQIHFSPDGSLIAAVTTQRVLIIDAQSSKIKNVITTEAPCSWQDIAWHSDSTHLVLLKNVEMYENETTTSFILLWNNKQQKMVHGNIQLNFAPIKAMWAPHNNQLAVVGEDLARHTGIVLVLKYSEHDTQSKYTYHAGEVTDCYWSLDGQTLLTTAASPKHRFTLLENTPDAYGNPMYRLNHITTPLPNHPRAQDSRLKLWQPCQYARCPDLKDLTVFEGDRSPVSDILSAAWSACGNCIATVDANLTLDVWNPHTRKHLAQMPDRYWEDYISKLTWLGRRLIAIANGRTVRLLDPFAVPDKQMVRHLDMEAELTQHPDTPDSPIYCYDIKKDGTFVAATTEGQLIKDHRLAKAMLHHRTGMNIAAALAARARTGRMPSALTSRRFVAPESLVDKRRKR